MAFRFRARRDMPAIVAFIRREAKRTWDNSESDRCRILSKKAMALCHPNTSSFRREQLHLKRLPAGAGGGTEELHLANSGQSTRRKTGDKTVPNAKIAVRNVRRSRLSPDV